MAGAKRIQLYDTTLRDGSQMEGVSFSLLDKLSIAEKLDDLGIDIIEGGYPASNPKERDFFREVSKLKLRRARIAAFGLTRRSDTTAGRDKGLGALVRSGVSVVTIVAKAWDLHVRKVLRTTPDENLRMIEDSVKYLKKRGLTVILDAEHYFDGAKSDSDYALKVVEVAAGAGADWVVLCDTNGGALPDEVADLTVRSLAVSAVPLGFHGHNDAGLAVANTLAAVSAGARQVQGTINGLGERTGNADLCTVIPNLTFKMGRTTLAPRRMKKLTEMSRFVYELANMPVGHSQPYVGTGAFSHKGGLHVDAIVKDRRTYEHLSPELVGNERRFLISELSGAAAILKKVEKLDLEGDRKLMRGILERVQDLENEGYQFESAEASFELMVLKHLGRYEPFFDLEQFRVIVEERGGAEPVTEATLKVRVGRKVRHIVAEGDGPVNALDNALRLALSDVYPDLEEMRLVDYKVRVINSRAATAAKVCVVIESRDHDDIWGTVGVSENIIQASWQALVDSVDYKLLKNRRRP